MKRVLTITAVFSITAAVMADSTLNVHPIKGVRHGSYELATGQLTPTQYPERYGPSIWEMTRMQPRLYLGSMDWFFATPDLGALVVDVGDITDGSLVDGFAFAYATDQFTPTTIDCEITFYSDYNGFNNNGWYALAGFHLSGLPTAVGNYNGWEITADLAVDPNDPNSPGSSFRITGNDIDGNEMVDFGYSYWFPSLSGADSATGPFICTPDVTIYPNEYAVELALGTEHGFDAFMPDPNDPDVFFYGGYFWIGYWDPNDPNSVYQQFYLALFGARPCGSPGASGFYCDADIDGSADCAVGLADLATLLANYGATAGVTHDGGDLEGRDGDVDLADLALLLAQYGDDCVH